ncbi:hypothetical protein RhiJN_19833 [Ceratobasidium sp. AG-Ba]|nr:hypothetical protein RhiJN_05001 [Ceratobasidium sp. AG-Ba]QRV91815.1 hypothetical protein RhiJN_19833 [Ceratobasidium sp. AG-Ba]
MNTSSSLTAQSTTWYIDTTAVSGTYTITTTFPLVVPLNTPSTTPAATVSATGTATSEFVSRAPARTAIIVGTIVGVAAVLGLAALLCLLCRLRHARPQFKLYQSDTSAKALDSNQSSGSAHALLDLAAEPEPHPLNIEPWVAPAVVRRSGKMRPTDETEVIEQQPTELPLPVAEHSRSPGPSRARTSFLPANFNHSPQFSWSKAPLPATAPDPPAAATRTLQLVQHDVTPDAGPSTSYNSKSALQLPQSRRRRAHRDPSPPRLEEDAGVSLMRAGDEPPLPIADEPPAYHFAVSSSQ